MKKYNQKHIGEKFITNKGYKVEIIDGGSKAGYNTIQIKNYIIEKEYRHIKKGDIKYPFHVSTLRRGFFGVGKYKSKINHKKTKEYLVWQSMLQRCYDYKYQEKHPTYIGTTICKEWHNFQVFAKWFEDNYIEGYELDKDLLSKTGNKIYSPDTCVFIPKALNIFLTNKQSNNTSGEIGVSWEKNTNKWLSQIKINGKKKYIGLFNNIKKAEEAYISERQKLADKWRNKMDGVIPRKAIEQIQ